MAGRQAQNIMKQTGLQGAWNKRPMIVEETTSEHLEMQVQEEQPPTSGANAAHPMELSPTHLPKKDNRRPRTTTKAHPSDIAEAT